MANPEKSAPKSKEYIPKPGDAVKVEGVIMGLMVVSVNKANKTAMVASARTPSAAYSVPWLQLSRLDESQNAARIVREATENS